MSSTKPVRLARPEEADDIFYFLIGLYEENALFPMDEYKGRQAIKDMLDRSSTHPGIIGVIDGPHGYEASVGMIIGEATWYTTSPSLEERWNFVHPDHRRSSHAKRLIQFSKSFSDPLGIPLIMGILSNERTEAKVRLYQRQLPMVGAFFMHGIERVVWTKPEIAH